MIVIIGANNLPPIRDIYPKQKLFFDPEDGLHAPQQKAYALEIYEEHSDAVVATGSQTILNELDNLLKDRACFFVWSESQRKVLPLSECVHLEWASHFALGDLYAAGELRFVEGGKK